MTKVEKRCPHTHYQILATQFNKRGLRRRQCRCTQCGHRWLTFSMTPAKSYAPWPNPWDIPLRRSLCV